MDDTKLQMILAYLAQGWALVPLHDVAAGRCSCGDAQCRSAGKHPRLRAWQESSQHVRTPEAATAIWGAHPEWNVGAATGEPSGFFAVDFDPKSAGDQARAWSVELDATGTRTHITGSDGRHWLFKLPNDFVPRNIGIKARGDGRVPVGIDVRGHHGQIVLPPSVSDRGSYRYDSGPYILPAPQWLLDAIRPPAYERPAAGAAAVLESATQGGRGERYAAAAGAALLEQLRSAPVGTRNDTAFAVACRLIELVNASWSGVSIELAHEAWWRAGAAHPFGEYVPDSELDGIWQRALARVGDTPAILPAGWGGELLPFSSPPTGADGSSAFGGMSDMSGVTSSVTGAVTGVTAQVGGVTAPVTDVTTPATNVTAQDPVEMMIGRMLTAEQLRQLPPPEPLIKGLLDLDTCAWLIGKPGSFKSFVALDFAAHVGRGEPWHGRQVRQGLAVYIVAEGARGMRLRVDAWEREYGELKEVLFLPEPVIADERRGAGGWTLLVEACRRLGPAMVIIDTQSRATVGLNENDNGDMSYYAAQADRIRRATGALVLNVHHIGRSGMDARGASAIDGAQDAELKVVRIDKSMLVELVTDKQKDRAEEKPVKLRLRVSAAPDSEMSSLVIERDGDGVFLDPEVVDGLTQYERRAIALYHVIRDQVGTRGEGATRAEIRALFTALPEIAKLSPSGQRVAFMRAWNGDGGSFDGLVPRGLLLRRDGADRFRVVELVDQSAQGVLTPLPRDAGPEAYLPPAGWHVHWPEDA